MCLAILSILFVLQYFAAMGFHGNMNYAVEHRQSLTDVILSYLRLDLLAWLFLASVARRIYLILRYKAEPSPFWDGLALGGVACFLAYLALRLFNAYYLAPVDLIAILYLGRLAAQSWNKVQAWRKAAALVRAAAIILQDASASAFWVIARKNIVHAKAEIASVVKESYLSGATRRLFFPFATPYGAQQFSEYLY